MLLASSLAMLLAMRLIKRQPLGNFRITRVGVAVGISKTLFVGVQAVRQHKGPLPACRGLLIENLLRDFTHIGD